MPPKTSNPKTLYHGELSKMGPVRVTVKSAVLQSTYKGKSPYVELVIGDAVRYYNCENDQCQAFWNGKVGQTFTIVAEGKREAATIQYVGEDGNSVQAPQQQAPQQRTQAPAQQQPQQRQAPPPQQHHQSPAGNGSRELTELKKHIARNSVACMVAIKAIERNILPLLAQMAATNPQMQDYQMGEGLFTSLLAMHMYGIDRKGLADHIPLSVAVAKDGTLQPTAPVRPAAPSPQPKPEPPPTTPAPTPEQYAQPAEPEQDVPF